jgi:hypothetical protein
MSEADTPKPTPEEARKFFHDHRLVIVRRNAFRAGQRLTTKKLKAGARSGDVRVMTLKKLTAAVRSGEGASWLVCETDDTGNIQKVNCPHCATGVEHPGVTVH